MTFVVWIAIGLAAVVFVIFAGWPLYNTYKTRGQGADVAEAQAYFKAKAEAERARSATVRDPQLPADSSDTGQTGKSHPLPHHPATNHDWEASEDPRIYENALA